MSATLTEFIGFAGLRLFSATEAVAGISRP